MFIACDAPTGQLEKLIFMRQGADKKDEVHGNDGHPRLLNIVGKRNEFLNRPCFNGSMEISLQVANGQTKVKALSGV